ncbi:MAG: CoB--CoM heterodisulfide reductase iron-sulfur subunit B family protein [Candidatus Bathyarchaeota archaeon]|nr:CoB--CoM heterodisulfide reductase iron-sulfur subunit B family protein [Candidatus Bathyarchaeota archaeon]MDI6805087.1 CoB--CoM heterodisulfide reductase iron-sulfur subunit B family protein [Candidatus Bathyarchaeia archaeon]
MKLAVFWGCRILTSQYAYEMSVREVFKKLNVELVDLSEANCCGDPIKSVKDSAANYLANRVLAIANATGLDGLLVPCNRCHFTISEAKDVMSKDKNLNKKIESLLKEEGLAYNSHIKIWHVIDFLHNFVGLDSIKKTAQKPLNGLRLATHVGCQIIRYSDLGRVDDAENPRKLDELVEALGAKTVDYAEKLDCCGAALMYGHPNSALSLAGAKIKALQNLGVDGLVISCPDCGLMFDFRQKDAAATVGAKTSLPVIYYTQLLGLALNIEMEKLGLHLNQSPVEQLLMKIST